jgi:hypothetical protein
MEMVVVMAIMAVIAALSFPAVSSGLESLRLKSASDSIVAFLNSGLNRAERRQQLIEIVVSRAGNNIVMRSEDPGFVRTLSMPTGVTIVKIHPEIVGLDEENERPFVLYPGGTVPRIGVEIVNRKGQHRIVRVDPITGVPQVETVGGES